MKKVSRRTFLKGSCATAVSAANLGILNSSLTSFAAQAQSQQDEYKALVCVFFLGGMDNHDTILPFDQSSYNQFAQVRGALLQQQGSTRTRQNLLPIDSINNTFGNRRFALPPQMPGLKALFDQGNMAVVGNVGPLIEPTSRTQFERATTRLPPRLFSHNDQQAIWQSSQPEGAQFGWGGRFTDAALANNGLLGRQFSAITSAGNELFLTGELAQPYQVSAGGAAAQVELLETLRRRIENEQNPLIQRLVSHFSAQPFNSEHVIEQDVTTILDNAFAANEFYNQAREQGETIDDSFPSSSLGAQLRTVAETIAVRDQLQTNRQVFLVAIGGFDTHSGQANTLPALQTQIDQGITAFYQTMESMGLADNVTLFTASDFGRTLAVNGDGTDHGWGAHHFVVGGAVNGQQIYGDIPPPILGHDLDAGSGRLIPSLAVEQYAAPMGRWFGLNETQLLQALPNLANFTAAPLGFI